MNEKKHVSEARSKMNGIVFHSNTFPLIGSETFRDDSGTIHSRIIPVDLVEFIDYLRGTPDEKKSFNKWIVIAFDAILVSLCLISTNLWLVLGAIYFSIFVSFDLFILVKIAYQMKSKKGKERSTARFHAAEHMVINAYEKLQRIPTFDEVKKSSRFSKKCGSRKIFEKISNHTLISLAIAFSAGWNSLVYLLLVIFIPIFMAIANRKGWLRFLQVFITTPPSDSEIELAIEGIKAFENMEEKIQNENKISMIITLPSDFPFPLF